MPHWNSLFTAFTCTFFCIFSSCSHLFAHSYFVRTVCPKIQACSDSRILDQHRWAGICHGSCRDSDCTGCVPFGNADLEIKMNFIAWAKVIASLVFVQYFFYFKACTKTMLQSFCDLCSWFAKNWKIQICHLAHYVFAADYDMSERRTSCSGLTLTLACK